MSAWNTFVLGLLLIQTYTLAATVEYNFESAQAFEAPATSTVSISGTRYKYGTHSLSWTWVANDALSLDLTSHSITGKSVVQGGLKLWIYNANSMDAKCLTIKITKKQTAAQTTACPAGSTLTHVSEFRFSLAFTGWRAAWVAYNEFENCPNSFPDKLPLCVYADKQVTMMQIQAPNTAGTVFIDALRFIDKMKSQSRDEIVPLIKCLDCATLNSGVTANDALMEYSRSNFWQQTYRWGILTTVPPASTNDATQLASKLSDLHLIEKRLLNWYADESTTFIKLALSGGQTYPQGVVTSNFYLRKRWDDLMDNVDDAYSKFRSLQVSKSGTPAVITGSPLFARSAEYGTSKTNGGDRKFGHVMHKVLLPLALEYHLKSRSLEVSNTACQWAKIHTSTSTVSAGDAAVNLVVGGDTQMKQTFVQAYTSHVASGQPPADCTGADATSYSKINHAITTINNQRKDNLLLLLEYLEDQGWVTKSSGGSTSHEMNQSGAGFANAVFLLRKELETAGRLQSHIDTLKWYTDFNEVYQNAYEYHGTTADRMRTILLFRLMAVLMMPEEASSVTPKPKVQAKIRDMENWKRWYDNALSINKGMGGVIKPDFTGFHHHGFYGAGYVPHALHAASIARFLINGTGFCATTSDITSREHLQNSLNVLKEVSVKYSTPNSIGGRFPGYSRGILSRTVAPFAYLAAASPSFETGSQTELGDLGSLQTEEAKAFLRFYDIGSTENCGSDSDFASKELKEDLCEGRFRSAIRYYNSLGSLQIMQKVKTKADNLMLVKESSPSGHWAKNFAALSIHRRENWAVTMKGFNTFVWDTELSSNENVFGIYQSHGALQISNSEDSLKRYDIDNGWDWAKIPGTTTIGFNATDLTTTNNRRLNHQTLGGGVTFSGKNPYDSSNGVFGMNFAQPSYKLPEDSPMENVEFNFKKSVFFEDDFLVCLGSDIATSNVENGAKTQTTLFQNKILSTETAGSAVSGIYKCNVGSAKTPAAWGAVASVVLEDMMGNRYFVKNPQDSGLHFQPRVLQSSFNSKGNTNKVTEATYCTAWLDHGVNPDAENYEYSVQIKGSAAISTTQSASDYNIIQRNSKAHVVKITKASTTRPVYGYVVFGPASGKLPDNAEDGPISSVRKGPGIVMAQVMEDNRLAVSITDPDIYLQKDTSAGSWCPSVFRDLPTTAAAFGDEYKFCAVSGKKQLRLIMKSDTWTVSKIFVNGKAVTHPDMNSNEDVKINGNRKVIDFRNLQNGFTTEVWFSVQSTSA